MRWVMRSKSHNAAVSDANLAWPRSSRGLKYPVGPAAGPTSDAPWAVMVRRVGNGLAQRAFRRGC